MLSPFDIDDDVSVLVQDHYNPVNAPELRTRIKILDSGNVVVTAPGYAEPMFAQPGQELVIEMSIDAQISVPLKFAIYRLTKARRAARG